jgi:ABC-type Fe3+-hydroxamate transport system substrate-binding protein
MKITIDDLQYIGPVYRDAAIRQLREPLLTAFDKYKTNIVYGIKVENEEQHQKILNWYQQLLDKEEEALQNIPEEIKYFL